MYDDVVPSFLVGDITPTMTIVATQAKLNSQGRSFNQANTSFNQTGNTFEGIYNRDQDIVPSFFISIETTPSIISFTDIQPLLLLLAQDGSFLITETGDNLIK